MVMWRIFFGFVKITKLILILPVNVSLHQCQMNLCYLHGNVNPRVAGHFTGQGRFCQALRCIGTAGFPLGFQDGLELGFLLGISNSCWDSQMDCDLGPGTDWSLFDCKEDINFRRIQLFDGHVVDIFWICKVARLILILP